MRGAQEFMEKNNIASVDGWIAYGASKRGMTTWMVGAHVCEKSYCPKIKGIIPVVPIVPNLTAGVHQVYKAYGALSFPYSPYADEKVIFTEWDSKPWQDALALMDPLTYPERMERIPKLVMVASNDEFMMFEWTANWWS